jgi:hypothetical protein
MASSVIREFLVNLGFKVDETGIKKFTDGIERQDEHDSGFVRLAHSA